MLLAKVVTAGAGTLPKLTLLANKARLEAVGSGRSKRQLLAALNWARKPRAYVAGMMDYDDYVKTDYTIVAEDTGHNYKTATSAMPEGGFSDRYMGRVLILSWAQNVTSIVGLINARVRWEA